MVFAVFDRNALLSEMRNPSGGGDVADSNVGTFHTFGDGEQSGYSGGEQGRGVYAVDQFNEMMQRAAAQGNQDIIQDATMEQEIKYADQLRPFDIVLNMQNEVGNRAKLSIYGCEILNEGMGFSIQDLSTNVQYSFVAKDITELTTVDENGNPLD